MEDTNYELMETATEAVVRNTDNGGLVKGILIGAAAIGGAWLGASLFKKFKNRAPKETEVEVVE